MSRGIGGMPALIVSRPVALVTDWPSAFVTVIVRRPGVAEDATERSSSRFVALLKVTPFTVTPPPLTVTLRCCGKLVPGSKKPAPLKAWPVSATFVWLTPASRLAGEQAVGVAGGGASNLTTRQA